MARPRAGHGWSRVKRGERRIDIIADSDGWWITTGEAVGWTRCERCRRPDHNAHRLDDGRVVCNICYYYKCIPKGTFWERERDYLFPYNIGQRIKMPPQLRPKAASRAAGGEG